MFDPKLEQLEDGSYDLPHIELIWMLNTAEQVSFYDSDIGFVETTTSPEVSNVTSANANKIPTVSLLGNSTVLNETNTEPSPTTRPFGWSAPEPDYVKFELPFNSPHGSKFAGFKFNYGEVNESYNMTTVVQM